MFSRSKESHRTLFFVIKPWPNFLKDDGVRYRSGGFGSLERFHNKITSLMKEHGIDYVEIKQRDLNERAKFVIDLIVNKWGVE